MRRFLRTASRSAHLPIVLAMEDTLHSFTASGRALFYFFAGLLVVSALGLLYILNQTILVDVPARGGSLSEGIVGSPRFINPALAQSDADRDLTALIYSGLLKATPEGSYVPDLASDYQVSEDGNVYTFTLRDDAQFHDGTAVSAADVVFTVAKIQDAATKSPLRASWDGVVAEEVDPQTVRFTLKGPYAPFIKNVTVGILPKHLWGAVSSDELPWSDLNTSPVGSGPFRIASIARSPSGIPTSYELRPYERYALGAPYLERLSLHFYQNEEALLRALREGSVDSASGLSPTLLSEESQEKEIQHAPLNRVFGVFFNQNQSEALRDHDVREALSLAIDREALVLKVLGGFGTPLWGPIPPNILQSPAAANLASAVASEGGDGVAQAKQLLIDSGWEENAEGILQKTTGSGDKKKTLTLAFSLSTGNVPELRAAVEELRARWEAVGAKVEVKVFEQGDLSQNVIRPRKYDALLFGEIVGRELDLFAFWHSSQRNDPGLNIALYANATADEALQKMRSTSEPAEREALYQEFLAELQRDLPAIFLYTPDFVYRFPEQVKGLKLGFIETPSDRFLSAPSWHTDSTKVWPFFTSFN